MSIMLENQAKQIVAEQSSTGTNAIGAAGGGSEQWAGVALPLVRKVFAQISSKDFVSVQPMNLPSGLVFYLDFKYGTAGHGKTNDSSIYGNAQSDVTKVGVDAAIDGGLYGGGSFGYTIATGSQSLSTQSTGSADSASVDFNAELDPADFKTVTVATSSLSGLDAEGVRAFRLISQSVDITDYPEYTEIDGGNVVFVVAASKVSEGFNGSVTFHKQPADNSRGDFEDRGSGISIPEINVELKSEAVVAKTRKLKAQWTPEFAQDLNAYHSIDAEAELTSLLSEYISMEIDLEILDMLIGGARTTEKWSAANNKVWSGTDAAGSWGQSFFCILQYSRTVVPNSWY